MAYDTGTSPLEELLSSFRPNDPQLLNALQARAGAVRAKQQARHQQALSALNYFGIPHYASTGQQMQMTPQQQTALAGLADVSKKEGEAGWYTPGAGGLPGFRRWFEQSMRATRTAEAKRVLAGQDVNIAEFNNLRLAGSPVMSNPISPQTPSQPHPQGPFGPFGTGSPFGGGGAMLPPAPDDPTQPPVPFTPSPRTPPPYGKASSGLTPARSGSSHSPRYPSWFKYR